MSVPRGHMVLRDRFDPPLKQGRYTVEVATTAGAINPPLPTDVRHLHIVGPRLGLNPAEIAGCYPPREGKGPFMDALPHIALGRRTLPWEITLDPEGRLPSPPARKVGEPDEPDGDAPWMALLLLEQSEVVSINTERKLSAFLSARQLADIRASGDATCTTLVLSQTCLRDIIPTVEEMKLLAHVREVNVEDRELSADDADGFFAVVMSNRVPLPGRKYRACLVSLEGRDDLLRNDYPQLEVGLTRVPVRPTESIVLPGREAESAPRTNPLGETIHVVGEPLAGPVVEATSDFVASSSAIARIPRGDASVVGGSRILIATEELVLLTSWTFECEGEGSFEALCGKLDSAMFGTVREEWPVVADTGHLALEATERGGSTYRAWYRGPLVPFPLTRDGGGPYHTAEECLRISVETGMEDISYAAAFEVGRLLAASDARFAQELMRWRRGAFRRSLLRAVRKEWQTRLPALDLRPELVYASLAANLLRPYARVDLPRIDPLSLDGMERFAGLRAEALAAAWGLSTTSAASMLAGGLDAFGGTLQSPATRSLDAATLAGVAGDVGALRQLQSGRTSVAAFQTRTFNAGGGTR